MTTDSPSSGPFRNGHPAPWWHTTLLVAVIIGFSVLQTQSRLEALESMFRSRVPIYLLVLAYEFSLLAYVWLLGLKPYKISIREMIGGRWRRLADFLIDVGVAFVFWLVVLVSLAFVRFFVHYNGLEAARLLLPRSAPEIILFLALCVTAGFCEEFIFRGYMQRQFLAFTGSTWLAISLQAIVFGIAHLYQGWRGVVGLTVYGALFGMLAWKRKSLRPGMMQHAAQDSFFGIVASILVKRDLIR